MYQIIYGVGRAQGKHPHARLEGRHHLRPSESDRAESLLRHRPPRRAHAGRSRQGCRRLRRTLQRQHPVARHGALHGRQPHRLRPCQPRARDFLRGRHGSAPRRAHVNRTQRLPQPNQQRHRLPLHLPRSPRRERHRHQRRDEDGCRTRHCRPRQADGARRRQPGLSCQRPHFRTEILHSQASRSATHHRGERRRCQSSHRERRGTQADHRLGCLQAESETTRNSRATSMPQPLHIRNA